MTCKLMIPNTFIVCGEKDGDQGFYCSSECHLRALLEKATPVTWHVFRCKQAEEDEACAIHIDDNDAHSGAGIVHDTNRDECCHMMLADDATLIVTAINALPKLLDKIETLEKQYETCFKERNELEQRLYGQGNKVNQCDGCAAGRAVDSNGNHHMGDGKYPDLMACQKDKYGKDGK